MKVSELKNMLKLHFSVAKKTFNPMTEYIFIGDKIRSTDLEKYVISDISDMIFAASITAMDLKIFLNSLDDDIELNFEKMDNYLNIKYGKNAIFKLPFSTDSFPELSGDNEDWILLTITMTENICEHFKNALIFCNKDSLDSLSGLFITNKNIYSTNREIVYCGNQDFDIKEDSFIFIPYMAAKFIIDNKINSIHVTNDKLIAILPNCKIHYMKKQDIKIPDFNKIFSKIKSDKSIISVEESKEIIESLKRCENFEETVNIKISDGIVSISNKRINEEVYIKNKTDHYEFRSHTKYLNNILSLCGNLSISKVNAENGELFGDTLNYKIMSALICLE